MRWLVLFFAFIGIVHAQTSNDNIKHKNYFVGYYESWSEPWVADGSQAALTKLPAYDNVVILSFMQPDATYTSGSFNLSGTGLNFSYDGVTLKQAVDALKQKNPNTKILVAVGGATYLNWNNLNVSAISNFIKDYKLDGVDIDYEVSPNCYFNPDQHIHCQSDQQYKDIVNAFRMALPRPYWLTVASWSIGAYGEDAWQNSKPAGDHTGMMLNLMRDLGDKIDMINVMSYDAGNIATTGFNPIEALDAYQHYFHGKISMGVEVAPEAWGGNTESIAAVDALIAAVKSKNAAGIMLWSLQKKPNGTALPDGVMVGKEVCEKLLENCSV